MQELDYLLQCFSTFSIISGHGHPKEWAARAAELGYKGMALTDKNNQAGHLEFMRACDKHEIDAIFGQSFTVVSDLKDKDSPVVGSIILLAKSDEGRANLINLANKSQMREFGFHKIPRIDSNMLADEPTEDLICIASVDGDWGKESSVTNYMLGAIEHVFQDDFYIGINPFYTMQAMPESNEDPVEVIVETEREGMFRRMEVKAELTPKQKKLLSALSSRAEETKRLIGKFDRSRMVITLNSHCVVEENAHLYDVLRNLDNGRIKKNLDRLVYKQWIPSKETMALIMSGAESFFNDLIDNTNRVGMSCHARINTDDIFMPNVDVVNDTIKEDVYADILHFFKEKICSSCTLDRLDDFEQLRQWGDHLSDEAKIRGETLGVDDIKKYNIAKSKVPEEDLYPVFSVNDYVDRLQHEMRIIEKLNFLPYFHAVAYMYKYVRSINGTAGPARGSAGGSLVAYLMGITKLDPLRHDLLFERFLNEERNDLPDIDMDFSSATRDALRQHLRNKYGKYQVINIGTFSRFKIVSAITNIARAYSFGIPDNDGEIVSYDNVKLSAITKDKGIKATLKGREELEARIDNSPKFRAFYDRHSDWIENVVMRMQGMIYNNGIHAAGVLILPESVMTRLPCVENAEKKLVVQFKDRDCEDMGYPKFDFLVIEALDVIEKTIEIIKRRHPGFEIPEIEHIPLRDKKVSKLFKAMLVDGLFQARTYTAREIMRQLIVRSLEDCAAANAIGRTGPMLMGTHTEYCRRSRGDAPVTYPHEDMAPILGNSLGLMIYQEQIIKTATDIARLTGSQADNIRKACGKKQMDKMKAWEEVFRQGALDAGYEEDLVDELWSTIVKFAEYGFNRSHSIAYALLTWMQAWLKVRFPVEFSCASMECGKTEKRSIDNIYNERYVLENTLGIGFKMPDISCFYGSFYPVDNVTIGWSLKHIAGIGEKTADAITQGGIRNSYDSIEHFIEEAHGRNCNIGHLNALIKAGFFDSICPPWEAARRVYKALATIKGDDKVIPVELISTDELYWANLKNEAFNHIVTSWKEMYNAPRGVSRTSRERLQAKPDNTKVRLMGQITSLRHTRNKKGWKAKIVLEDVQERYTIHLQPDFWENEDLDEKEIRPEPGDIVVVTACKQTWNPPDEPEKDILMLYVYDNKRYDVQIIRKKQA